MRYFEDIEVGEPRTVGERTVTQEAIIDFAERYDPQPFHVDPAAARDSLFEGLTASGFHTMGLCQRMAVDGFHSKNAAAGGAGIGDIRMPRPVRPGDTLTVEFEVAEKRPLDSYPGRGLVTLDQTVVTGDGEAVLEMTTYPIVDRRPD